MALTTKGHFKIDDEEFKAQSLSINFESIISADSGKSDDGFLQLDFVLGRTRQVQIAIPPASGSEVSRLLNLVQGRVYNLTYFDALDNAEKTIQCYTSSSSTDLYSGVILNGLWNGVSFTAIELGGEI